MTDLEKVWSILARDFPRYSRTCLKIRPKVGGLIPLKLNRSQTYVHECCERQLREKGRVRALVLKARQEGMSTYIQARYFWKVTHRPGIRAFIQTHEQEATDSLFEMAQRFLEHLPEPMQPNVSASNAKELHLGKLDSGYRVATARTKAAGRSQTVQLFHGSEVAFWANAEEHMAGVMQAIPQDGQGTEVILESTANGPMGLFYELWQAAEAGESEYEPIFLPWYWHAEYEAEALPEALSQDWREYQALYDLSDRQLAWAWQKNKDMSLALGLDSDSLCWQFRQEYPATAEEAYQTADQNSFIRGELVTAARKADIQTDPSMPLVLGVDVAGSGGGDKTWIIDRQGRVAGSRINERFREPDQMVIAGRLARVIDDLGPAQVFVDVGGGYGSGVYDRLVERGYGAAVTAVQFGGRPENSRDYANKRAEMWGDMKDWLSIPGGVSIPDDGELHSHLTAPGSKPNSSDQTVLESKEKIRDRLHLSPDGGDALALTFAERVRPKAQVVTYPTSRYDRTSAGWMGA